jgi:predicted enzyme related to lactoylglutathione lyase
MSDPFKQHGAFSWCELRTSDLEEAKAFYSSLLGWDLEDRSIKGGTYTVVTVGGKGVGGMIETSPKSGSVPARWGAYVTVDDVDATAKKAEELGGKILVPPQDIRDVLRLAMIQDPQGATISVITYAVRE